MHKFLIELIPHPADRFLAQGRSRKTRLTLLNLLGCAFTSVPGFELPADRAAPGLIGSFQSNNHDYLTEPFITDASQKKSVSLQINRRH